MQATDNTTENFTVGQRIVTKGDKPKAAYLINKGRVRVYLEQNGKILDLTELGPNQIFGETALFTEGTYGANVDALEDTNLTVITPETLNTKMETCDPMLRSIIKMLIHRLNDTNNALLESETREFIDIAFI